MMGIHPVVGALVLCLGLGGCAFAGMGGDAPMDTYDLSAPDVTGIGARTVPVHLAVGLPSATAAVDTNRVMVKEANGRVSYYPGVAWSDRLPRLLQRHLLAALQDSQAFRAVVTSQDRVQADFSLAWEIRAYHITVDKGRTQAVARMFVKVIDEKRNQVVASKDFSAGAAARADDAASGIEALREAFEKIAVEIVAWTASRRSRIS